MKINEIVALSALVAAVSAAAVPARNKRQDTIYYSTTTDIITDVVWTTTTVWVQPSASAQQQIGGFFESYSQSTLSSVTAAPVAVNAPDVVNAPAAPAPSTSTTSTTSAAAVPAVDPPAPSPTTTTTSADPPAPSPAAPTASPAATTSSSSGGQGQYIGDMTYYDVSVGLGSCGTQGTNSQDLVALAADVMQNPANPNANPKCGQTINIYYNGETHTGTVYDTCPTCDGGSIDVTQELFLKVAPNGDGRVHDVSWSFA